MTFAKALEGQRCQYHAETADQQCGRGASDRFGGLDLCSQHRNRLERSVLTELYRDRNYEMTVRRELATLEDGRDDDLRKPDYADGTTVYFLKRFQLVKIGYAADVRKRIKDINAGSAIIPGMVCVRVKLLATIPGGRAREQALHQRFHHLRVGGEWFVGTDELMRFIDRIGDAKL